jgi:hypothetical protein
MRSEDPSDRPHRDKIGFVTVVFRLIAACLGLVGAAIGVAVAVRRTSTPTTAPTTASAPARTDPPPTRTPTTTPAENAGDWKASINRICRDLGGTPQALRSAAADLGNVNVPGGAAPSAIAAAIGDWQQAAAAAENENRPAYEASLWDSHQALFSIGATDC